MWGAPRVALHRTASVPVSSPERPNCKGSGPAFTGRRRVEFWEEGPEQFLEALGHAVVTLVIGMDGVGHIDRFKEDAFEEVGHVKDSFLLRQPGEVFLVPVPERGAMNADQHDE